MSEINKYLEKGEEQIEEKSGFNMSEINKYLLKGEEEDKPDFNMSEINKYLDKGPQEEEEQSDWMNGIGGISEMQ